MNLNILEHMQTRISIGQGFTLICEVNAFRLVSDTKDVLESRGKFLPSEADKTQLQDNHMQTNAGSGFLNILPSSIFVSLSVTVNHKTAKGPTAQVTSCHHLKEIRQLPELGIS